MRPAQAIYDALTEIVADPLHPSGLNTIVTGGVWRRRIIRPPSKGATPEAFDAGGRALTSIVVLDRGEDSDPLGPFDIGSVQAFGGFPQIWIYARAVDTGRDAIEAVVGKLITLFQGELNAIEADNGTSAGIRVAGHQGVDDDPEMEAVLFDMLRLQVDGMWVI